MNACLSLAGVKREESVNAPLTPPEEMFTKIPGGREVQAYKPYNLGALPAEADPGVVGTWLTVAVITMHPDLFSA